MKHGFDVVAIRIENECGVVARVVRALAGRPVFTAPGSQRGTVERVHRLEVRHLEREVDMGDVGIGGVDEQLIGMKSP